MQVIFCSSVRILCKWVRENRVRYFHYDKETNVMIFDFVMVFVLFKKFTSEVKFLISTYY